MVEVAQTQVKRLSTIRETQVQSLGWEDPLEKEMAIHSSTISWKIPWTEKHGRPTVHGVVKSRTLLSNFIFTLTEPQGFSEEFSSVANPVSLFATP